MHVGWPRQRLHKLESRQRPIWEDHKLESAHAAIRESHLEERHLLAIDSERDISLARGTEENDRRPFQSGHVVNQSWARISRTRVDVRLFRQSEHANARQQPFDAGLDAAETSLSISSS